MSTMRRATLAWLVLTLAGAGYLDLQAAPQVAPQTTVLNRYCVTCHSDRVKQAGLALTTLDEAHVDANAAAWEKVVRKLRTGTMPPAGSPRPDQATYDSLATSLERALDRAAEMHPNPGQKPALHRLNRAEYTNAIRDLLALPVDGAALLPADEASYGFDNIAGVLTVSPGLLDRYILAARKISQAAVGDPALRSSVETYRLSPFVVQTERMSEDLPFGSRGGIVIRHHFPLDGEYVLRVRMRRNFSNDSIGGLQNREGQKGRGGRGA